MRVKLKYVITKKREAIIFSPFIEHSTFSGREPVSAGFLFLKTTNGEITAEAYGKSVSLGLETLPCDSYILTCTINEELPNLRKIDEMLGLTK